MTEVGPSLPAPGGVRAGRRSHLRPLLPFACRWVRRIYIHANTLTTLQRLARTAHASRLRRVALTGQTRYCVWGTVM